MTNHRWIGPLLISSFLLGACTSSNDAGLEKPVSNLEAAGRAFQLYYRERVERAALAHNRFLLVGDATFGVTIGKAGIARQGDEFEVVPGPNDNNRIGFSIWTTWHAFKIFRSRALELSLIRMFNGLSFFEAISGHPGLTARMVYPGWTRTVDGRTGTITRTRDDAPAVPGESYSPNLEAEILDTFYEGVRITYREDPSDFFFSYMPAVETGRYAATYSFSELPSFLRSSDCCTSLMRTPAPYAWAGAYWGNHNSRDNFPDLAFGLLAAREAKDDTTADPDLRAAAQRAFEAGQRIGDLIQAHDAIMTVDEHNPYDTLINSGAVRPDGETEIEDLGILANCQMAYLSRAISSQGLALPLPEVQAPGSIEYLLVDALGQDVSCEVTPGDRVCSRLEEAFCGEDWATMEQMEIYGTPWLDLVRSFEQGTPGMAEELIGGFQDDFHEISLAALALVYYADIVGDAELATQARGVLGDLTALMRVFADIIYAQNRPDRLTERLYEAALLDAHGGLESTPTKDLGDFGIPEGQVAYLESWLTMDDTLPAALLTDEEIQATVEERLQGLSETVKQRYLDHYGDTPPVRRKGEGYEARGVPEAEHPWQAVERPRHRIMGGARLLHALPLCNTAPDILDCTWAALGCARPDLNADGQVDEADTTIFDAARASHADAACRSNNDWCGGADLDHTGTVDATDTAFLEAAQGCHYN